MDRAFEAKDIRVWDEIFSQDYTATFAAAGQTISRAQVLAMGAAQAKATIPPVSVQIRPTRVQVRGDLAYSEWQELACYGVAGVTGKVHRFCYEWPLLYWWRKENGTWRVTRMHFPEASKETFDGRVVTREERKRILGQ